MAHCVLVLLLATIWAVHAALPPPLCVNGLVYEDRDECECFTCWSGPACSIELSECLLSCETNEGYVQTDYWTQDALGDPHTDISSSYRTDYMDPQVWHPGNPDPPPGVFGAIRKQILRVHEMVGNVKDIESYSMVVAHGATQMINGAIDALSQNQGLRLNVIAPVPYYYLIPGVTRVAKGAAGFLAADEALSLPPQSLVEVITSPRNPDGIKNTTTSTSTSNVIYDNVFYWPSFTEMEGPLDLPIMVFSLSKLAGLSGSRLGWAFVKDPAIADAIGDYIYYSTHGVTVDAQYRAANVLKRIADDRGILLAYVNETLRARWDWVVNAFAEQAEQHYAIAGTFGFPVLWINCLDFPGKDGCSVMFAQVGINVRSGGEFGSPGFVRMNMMVHDVTWGQCQERLQVLLGLTGQTHKRRLASAKQMSVSYPRYSS